MLEFSLLAWGSENYNINRLGALAGNIDRVFRACGVHLRGSGLDFPGFVGRL